MILQQVCGKVGRRQLLQREQLLKVVLFFYIIPLTLSPSLLSHLYYSVYILPFINPSYIIPFSITPYILQFI